MFGMITQSIVLNAITQNFTYSAVKTKIRLQIFIHDKF